MKVLFIDQYGDPGGAQHCLLDLLPEFAARSWTAVVAAPPSGPLLERCTANGAIAEHLPQRSYTRGAKTIRDTLRFGAESPALALDIHRLLRTHRPDILYVNGPRPMLAAAMAACRRLPLVFHSHNYLRYGYGAVPVGIALAACAATVIASCEFVAGPLRRYVPPERLHVIYNGVGDCGGIERPPSAGVHRIGLIARICPEKGQAEFVNAARWVLLSGLRCRFIAAGAVLFDDAEAMEYFHRVRDSARGLPVEFPGWNENIAELLANLDLLVVPSDPFEATTRVIPEAWSARVPVLAFHSGGIDEIIRENITGFQAGSWNPEVLGARILHILGLPPAQIESITAAARARYEQQFTLERFRTGIADLLASLV